MGIFNTCATAGNESNSNVIPENKFAADLNYGFENAPNITATATDNDKNLFVTGSVVLSGFENAFLAKFDSKGNLTWKMVTGGNHYGNHSTTLSVDKSGNSIITGDFSGQAKFGNIILEGARRSCFIAKFDSRGNCLSAEKTGTDIN